MQKDQHVNHIVDLMSTEGVESQAGEDLIFSNVTSHKIAQSGSSGDWKTNTFPGLGENVDSDETIAPTKGSTSSEPPTETNINGLTSSLKQISLSPKTVSGDE